VRRNVRRLAVGMRAPSAARRRVTRYIAGVVVAAGVLSGTAVPAVAATSPTLGVVVVGSGMVTSQPAGIDCPGKCIATFAAGTSVTLTGHRESGSTFLGWGGSCTGSAVCVLKVSALSAVAAQFSAGSATSRPAPSQSYIAVAGRYSGPNGQNPYGLSFYVAPGGRSMLNFESTSAVTCTPSGAGGDTLAILAVPVHPNGSFSGTSSFEELDHNGLKTKVTYTVSGNLHGASSAEPAGAAGTWREDWAYPSQPGTTCTSNEQSWTATLQGEASGPNTVVEPGPYSGPNGNNPYGITFSVAPGGRSILNVSSSSDLVCAPSGSAGDHLTLSDVAVNADGSFSAQTSQEGVLNGNKAKFIYTFAGHFEDPASGQPNVAGTWREVVMFASGATTMCDSRQSYWDANLQS
jgi:hypothetical protein